MKRIIATIFSLTLLVLLCSCGSTRTAPAAGSQRLSVVATIFPEYDWASQVLGERAGDVELTLLLDSGVDLHSFQPSAKDMVTISGCDLFIYVGGESDHWVEAALAGTSNPNRIVINLMELLGQQVKQEEIIEGMDVHEEEESGEAEYDEHVWLSLSNAATACRAIRDALSTLDQANAPIYEANTAAYLEQLEALDKRYAETLSTARYSTLLFGDRFPFRYLADDYGLRYYAAFPGCSAETEASFETIVFLANKLQELELPSVMTLEGSDGKIAQTIISTAAMPEVTIRSLDSMQSRTGRDAAAGVTYLSIMEQNLDVLKQALNRED